MSRYGSCADLDFDTMMTSKEHVTALNEIGGESASHLQCLLQAEQHGVSICYRRLHCVYPAAKLLCCPSCALVSNLRPQYGPAEGNVCLAGMLCGQLQVL